MTKSFDQLSLSIKTDNYSVLEIRHLPLDNKLKFFLWSIIFVLTVAGALSIWKGDYLLFTMVSVFNFCFITFFIRKSKMHEYPLAILEKEPHTDCVLLLTQNSKITIENPGFILDFDTTSEQFMDNFYRVTVIHICIKGTGILRILYSNSERENSKSYYLALAQASEIVNLLNSFIKKIKHDSTGIA